MELANSTLELANSTLELANSTLELANSCPELGKPFLSLFLLYNRVFGPGALGCGYGTGRPKSQNTMINFSGNG
ncbi:hypothetical protein FACS1894137_02720 [Spirochaetia bacterium]|nr:hypothetical protein FACS1894137_02720 [Spirochaetia bacterium]